MLCLPTIFALVINMLSKHCRCYDGLAHEDVPLILLIPTSHFLKSFQILIWTYQKVVISE